MQNPSKDSKKVSRQPFPSQVDSTSARGPLSSASSVAAAPAAPAAPAPPPRGPGAVPDGAARSGRSLKLPGSAFSESFLARLRLLGRSTG